MKCPICGTENTDDWPVTVDDKIETGGCQSCWEKEVDKSWWGEIEKVYVFEGIKELSK